MYTNYSYKLQYIAVHRHMFAALHHIARHSKACPVATTQLLRLPKGYATATLANELHILRMAAVYLYSAVYMQASTAAVYWYSAVYMQASTAAMTSSGRGLVAAPVFHACCGMSTYVYVRVCIDVCICAGTFTWTLT